MLYIRACAGNVMIRLGEKIYILKKKGKRIGKRNRKKMMYPVMID